MEFSISTASTGNAGCGWFLAGRQGTTGSLGLVADGDYTEQQQPVTLDATQVTFETGLKTGTTTFKSWWYNTESDTLAGAY